MKPMSQAILLSAAMLAGTTVRCYAADVTFYEQVAPIFQANCVSCHRPAGQNIGSLVAPMIMWMHRHRERLNICRLR